MTLTLHWPQLLVIVLTVMGVGIHMAKHGEKRDDYFNAGSMFLISVFEMWVLYMGGFFG
jgi:hypothetical protein